MTDLDAARIATTSPHAGEEPRRTSVMWWLLPCFAVWVAIIWWGLS